MGDIDLESLQGRGDEEADAFVAAIALKYPQSFGSSARRNLLKVVGQWEPRDPQSQLVVDSHTELRDFIFQPVAWPAWGDRERVARAQSAYVGRRLRARLVLAHASLPVCYLYGETARTLAGTGQLLQHPRRRIFETVRFVETVMRIGSFDGAPAPASLWLRKVRLTHALVRAAVRDVDASKDPMPLDQLEVSFVLQTFGHLLAEGLQDLRKGLSETERGDHLHAWSVVGSMLGVLDELLPEKGEKGDPDAGALYRDAVTRLLAPGDPFPRNPGDPMDDALSGRLLSATLCAALVQTTRERLPRPLMRLAAQWPWLDEAVQSLPRILIRRLSSVPVARQLRVGRAPLVHWIIGQVALRLVDLDKAADYPIDPQAPQKRAAVVIPAYLSM